MAANKGRRLEDGLEKSNDHDLPRVMDEASPQGQQTPGNHAAWEVDARCKLLKRKVVRNLSQHIAAVKDCQ